MSRRVVVVGGGIGGLALALALQRRGVPVDVLEAARELTATGGGLQLSPAATRHLQEWGVVDALGGRAGRPEATVVRRWADGRTLARVPLGEDCRRAHGAPYLTLRRSDLQDALRGALARGTVATGRQARRVDLDPTGAPVVELEDGTRRCGWLVVGADGTRSALRAHVVDRDPVRRRPPYVVHRGWAPAGVVAGTEDTVQVWVGPQQHLVAYPCRPGGAVNVVAVLPWGRAPEEAFRQWHAAPRLLADGLRGSAPRGLELVATLPRWSRGPVTLLGDAAHPMLPFHAQGAGQAVEDAAALAEAVDRARRRRHRPASACSRYEAGRRPRAEQVKAESDRRASSLHLPDGPAQQARDAAMAGADLASMAWLFSDRVRP